MINGMTFMHFQSMCVCECARAVLHPTQEGYDPLPPPHHVGKTIFSEQYTVYSLKLTLRPWKWAKYPKKTKIIQDHLTFPTIFHGSTRCSFPGVLTPHHSSTPNLRLGCCCRLVLQRRLLKQTTDFLMNHENLRVPSSGKQQGWYI